VNDWSSEKPGARAPPRYHMESQARIPQASASICPSILAYLAPLKHVPSQLQVIIPPIPLIQNAFSPPLLHIAKSYSSPKTSLTFYSL